MLTSPWPDLDHVVEIDETHVVADRATTVGEELYQHHFPGKPITPAVMLLSWIEHAAGVLVAHASRGERSAIVAELERISCLKIASPGDTVRVTVTLVEPDATRRGVGERFAATAQVARGEDRILRARLAFEIVPLRRPEGWSSIAEQIGVRP